MAVAHSARSSSFAIHADRICPVGSWSTQPFHIRANAAGESRSRPRSNNLRFAHAGSIFRPRRPSRSRVTRWRTSVTALFPSMIRWKWSTAMAASGSATRTALA